MHCERRGEWALVRANHGAILKLRTGSMFFMGQGKNNSGMVFQINAISHLIVRKNGKRGQFQ